MTKSREVVIVKRAVSVSLGSSKRDKAVEVELLGTPIHIERVGTDGDMEKAAQKFKELDGQVDAFGVGGADLGLMVDDKWYPLYSVNSMVRFVRQTPVVDGTGIKNTLEGRVGAFLEANLAEYLDAEGRKVFVATGADRWGMTRTFTDHGYECIFGDFMFGLGLPITIRTIPAIKRLAGLVMPLVSRLPFNWIYPTGAKQEVREPKWEQQYNWATVIAGDRHYVVRHMPERLPGKIVVTNTTTLEDVQIMREIGIKYLVTTTPVLAGRSFGANMMEAALIAVAGKGRKLTNDELNAMLDQLELEPQLQELN
jgi:hypothetical protein